MEFRRISLLIEQVDLTTFLLLLKPPQLQMQENNILV